MPITAELVPAPTSGRIFEQSVRPGLADAAPSGRVRLDALARWLQDVAYADVDDAALIEGAVWVVRRLRLVVGGFPRFGETVSMSTFCSGLGRMWAERRTSLASASGQVEAVAIWIHLDPESRRPIPFSDAEFATYAESAGGRVVKARLRHPAPGPDAIRSPWVFRAAETDLAGHVNNAAYWQPLEERLLAGAEPAGIDAEIEFRAPAQPGAVQVLADGNRMWIAALDGELHASLDVASAGEP
jgi:acyl-ACP thioesterase